MAARKIPAALIFWGNLRLMDLLLITAVCLTQFFTSFMGSSLNVAVAALAVDFAVEPQNITWVINMYTTMSASFLLCATAIAERFGYRRIYSTGLALSAASCLLLALCPNYPLMLLGRALQGIMFSLIFCTSMAILVSNISKEKRAVGIGLATASVYCGLSLSPVIAGLVIDLVSWRGIFVIAACGIALAFCFSTRIHMDEPQFKRAKVFDLSLSFAGIFMILISFSLLSFGNVVLVLCAVGVLTFAWFLLRQSRQRTPLLSVTLFRDNQELRWALVASYFNYMANFSLTFLLSLHIQYVLGLSASLTGLLLLIQPLMMMTLSVFSGKLSAIIDVHVLTLTGMTLIALSFVMLSFLNPNSSLIYMLTGQFICGVGFGLFSAPNTNIVMSSVQKDKFALVSALQSLTRNAGQASSMAVATWLLTHFIDAAAGTTLYIRELSGSISFIFMLSAAAGLVGSAACAFGLWSHRKKQAQ